MKIKQFITALATILILVGCTSEKDQYMNDWRQLIKTVETDKKLSDKELKNASDKYEQLNGKLTQYYNQLKNVKRLVKWRPATSKHKHRKPLTTS